MCWGEDLTFIKRCETPINQSIQAWSIRAPASPFPRCGGYKGALQTQLSLLLYSLYIQFKDCNDNNNLI